MPKAERAGKGSLGSVGVEDLEPERLMQHGCDRANRARGQAPGTGQPNHREILCRRDAQSYGKRRASGREKSEQEIAQMRQSVSFSVANATHCSGFARRTCGAAHFELECTRKGDGGGPLLLAVGSIRLSLPSV